MKTIRVGVLGAGAKRGATLAGQCGEPFGMKLVALCDCNEQALAQSGERFGVATYTDYDAFLAHDMDAVIVSNFFHEHAPYAIRALQAGKHVMSETLPCFTLAEGVALIDAVEASGKTFMFAENYPYSLWNHEIRRVYQSGKLGTFMYGESEYVHPESADFWNVRSPGMDHWRNWIPATYYSTHSLAPIMVITDTWPTEVNGFVVPHTLDDPIFARTVKRHDPASVIMLRMDNGALVRLLQVYLRGHEVWVRIHGSRGQIENVRGNHGMIRLRREQFHERQTGPVEQFYRPKFPIDHDRACRFGHGGGDFFMSYYFAKAIRENTQPFLDVYRGVAMSAVAILSYRSALEDSRKITIPDFRKKTARRQFADDHWRPSPAPGKGQVHPSVKGRITPSDEALAYARKNWKQIGYTGDQDR